MSIPGCHQSRRVIMDRIKDALLKRYLQSADGFKKRFRSAKPELGETPAQFLTRLDNYLER